MLKDSMTPSREGSQDEVLDALEDVRAAQSRFDMATGKDVDAAIYDLDRATARFDAALARARSLFCSEGLDRKSN